jgi:hypothetical protein
MIDDIRLGLIEEVRDRGQQTRLFVRSHQADHRQPGPPLPVGLRKGFTPQLGTIAQVPWSIGDSGPQAQCPDQPDQGKSTVESIAPSSRQADLPIFSLVE